jgi:hypothetical protein
MRKTVLYTLLFALSIAMRPQSLDIGTLRPVQLVSMYREDEWIVIETDTDDQGRGGNVQEAIQNLKDTTPGTIYLDTADFLVVRPDTQNMISEISQYLKQNVKICSSIGGIAPIDAAKYLSAHPPRTNMREWRKSVELEVLQYNGMKLRLKKPKKDENNA